MEEQKIGTGLVPADAEDGGAVTSREPSGDDLVRLALERGADVEVLERLVALRERMAEREARKAFFDARAAFQEACPPILKSKDGLRTKAGKVVSKYAPLDKILAVAGPVLREHGFSWSWNSRMEDGQQHVDCVLTHELGHSDTSTFTAPVHKISSLTSGAQDHAGAATYGRRQSFVMVTGIYTADADNDGAVPPPESISASEAADLAALADEVGADRAKFLNWFGVDSFRDVPAARHREAVQALERKRKEGRS